jgi:cell division septum initiation protein DivIVA
VTDSWMKGRVKGLLGGASLVNEPVNESQKQTDAPSDTRAHPDAQRQALQVLNLAQRTADEHVASAHRQAEKICANARGTAEQIVRDAETHAQELRREADKALSEARASAAQMAQDAQAHADSARRNADKALADARLQADEIAKNAQASADELEHRAQQRYEEVVGGLAAKREALQRQIEALEQFDRDYRARLTTFMQAQLRALWVDQPHVEGDKEQPDPPAAAVPIPAQAGR